MTSKYRIYVLAGCFLALPAAPVLAHPGAHGGDAHEQADGTATGDETVSDDEREDEEDVVGSYPNSPYNDPVTIPTYKNGFGPDPDGDTNPATNTRPLSLIGDAAEAAFDPPYRVVTFEAPPGGHKDKIRNQYHDELGVTFSRGLSRQICEGQRYFQYNSDCTYRRAPSGQFAAAYRDDFKRPLRIRFASPVCVTAMAIYPTGGKEGERYEVSLQGYDAEDEKLDLAKSTFQWTKNTFRWRHMAGAYFLDHKAQRVDVSVKSLDRKDKNVRFLIDDLAFIEGSCSPEAAAAAIRQTPSEPSPSPEASAEESEEELGS